MEGRLQTAWFDWIVTISGAFVDVFFFFFNFIIFLAWEPTAAPITEQDKPLNKTSSSVVVFTLSSNLSEMTQCLQHKCY